MTYLAYAVSFSLLTWYIVIISAIWDIRRKCKCKDKIDFGHQVSIAAIIRVTISEPRRTVLVTPVYPRDILFYHVVVIPAKNVSRIIRVRVRISCSITVLISMRIMAIDTFWRICLPCVNT